MEQKKVNLSLIFSLVIFAIGVGIKSIASYFGGYFGIAFVATLILLSLVIVFVFSNPENRKRVLDVVILDCLVVFLGLVLYCAYDWARDITVDLVDFVMVWANLYSVVSLFCFGYASFRLFCEASQKRIKFVEVILGNEKVERKPRQPKEARKVKSSRNLKEVENGDLLDKPKNDDNNIQQDSNVLDDNNASVGTDMSHEQAENSDNSSNFGDNSY